MKIEVFGNGCPKCFELERRVRAAVAKAGLDATVSHVSDLNTIVEQGVLSPPAVVVDGTTVVEGRLPSVDELAKILKG